MGCINYNEALTFTRTWFVIYSIGTIVNLIMIYSLLLITIKRIQELGNKNQKKREKV